MDKLAMNFTPFYIMANVRHLLSGTKNLSTPNWVLATQIFAVGSTSANQVCREAGIDPFGYEVKKITAPVSPAEDKTV
jgi:hypothetical protein